MKQPKQHKPRILYTDVETFPANAYVWRTGDQHVSLQQIKKAGGLLCWSGKFEGERGITFRSLWEDGNGGHEMVLQAYYTMAAADMIVHYNGCAFDIKVFNTEIARRGLTPPAPSQQIDLYKVVKQNFQLPSYKLEYVLKFFGLPQKMRTGGFDLWADVMDGDEKACAKMRRYNIRDTLVLRPLYKILRPWMKSHPNFNLYYEDGKPRCSTCGSKHLISNGYRRTGAMRYRRIQCQDCGAWNYELQSKPGQLRNGR